MANSPPSRPAARAQERQHGDTHASQEQDSGAGLTAAPRLPHERDESADSQQTKPRKVMQQAHDDLERGLVDTDRGPVANRTYQQLKKAPR